MNSLMYEHLFRLSWCFLLMLIHALVEFNILPGKRYKIRPKETTTVEEVAGYFLDNARVLVLTHILPLFLWEKMWYSGPVVTYSAVAPTYFTILWKSTAYMVVFDTLTHFLHDIGHRVGPLVKRLGPVPGYFAKEHAIHHKCANRYLYAWTGFIGSYFEGLSGLVFFQISMLPLKMDPLTRIFAILLLHFCATNAHSGYDFPWFFHNWNPFGRYVWHGGPGHYIHHKLGRKNMSTFFNFYDRVFGTLFRLQDNFDGNEFVYKSSKIANLPHLQ
jgi:sterol desaturase/sphingolipid hydroxylase (fatty acid hydroxylase superfamily)